MQDHEERNTFLNVSNIQEEIVYSQTEVYVEDTENRLPDNNDDFSSSKYNQIDEKEKTVSKYSEVDLFSDTSEIKFELYGQTVSGRKTYKCLSCGKVVRERSEHKIAHTNGKNFTCSFPGCGKTYKRKQGLRLHYPSHQTTTYSCDKCGKTYRTPHLLYKHRTISCNHEPAFSCNICGKKLKSARQLNYHTQLHSDEKNSECHLCGKCFQSDDHLKFHLKSHDDASVQCYCGKTFRTWAECKAHRREFHDTINNQIISSPKMANENESTETLYECTMCKVKFKKKYSFTKHMLHHSEANIPCSHCEKKFKTNHHLKLHLQCHAKPYKCLNCSMCFQNLNDLQNHETLTKCDPVKTEKCHLTYQCGECLKLFDNANSARTHTLARHFDVDSVTISTVSDDEMQISIQLQDAKQALQDAIYNCESCDAVFRLESSLTKHELEKHRSQNRLKCSVCPVKFISNRTLRKHEFDFHQIGVCERCSVCDRQFHNKEKLSDHVNHVHPGQI